jgi:hypothetical protein
MLNIFGQKVVFMKVIGRMIKDSYIYLKNKFKKLKIIWEINPYIKI